MRAFYSNMFENVGGNLEEHHNRLTLKSQDQKVKSNRFPFIKLVT